MKPGITRWNFLIDYEAAVHGWKLASGLGPRVQLQRDHAVMCTKVRQGCSLVFLEK
jgi:hypothetical protein